MKPTEPPKGFCLALTGGLACGKTEAGLILERKGAILWDADQVAREVMAPGTAVSADILRRFGPDVAWADGSLNRSALAARVFGNPDERAALNAMVHPPLLTRLCAWKEQARLLQQKAVAIIPLLYEVGAEAGWDAVICIGASKPIVFERLQKRGLSRSEAELWLAAQWPVEEKMKRADYPVWNDGSLRELNEKLSILWKDILNKKESEHHG